MSVIGARLKFTSFSSRKMSGKRCMLQGVYWDTAKGCLRGTWENGVLKGQGTYDQPSYQFQGNFKANLPEGECSFTICAHRTLGMPAKAAAHILANHGPVMQQKGNYTLPPGIIARLDCMPDTPWQQRTHSMVADRFALCSQALCVECASQRLLSICTC